MITLISQSRLFISRLRTCIFISFMSCNRFLLDLHFDFPLCLLPCVFPLSCLPPPLRSHFPISRICWFVGFDRSFPFSSALQQQLRLILIHWLLPFISSFFQFVCQFFPFLCQSCHNFPFPLTFASLIYKFLCSSNAVLNLTIIYRALLVYFFPLRSIICVIRSAENGQFIRNILLHHSSFLPNQCIPPSLIHFCPFPLLCISSLLSIKLLFMIHSIRSISFPFSPSLVPIFNLLSPISIFRCPQTVAAVSQDQVGLIFVLSCQEI